MSTQFSKVYAWYVWKQWEIWLQNCKMDTKNNTMHANPKHKWCIKNLVKNLETENFLVSIDRESIKCQSRQSDSNQNFYRNFNRLSNKFDRLKIWKNQIFEKQSILMQKLLKTQYFMNKMHEYEMKSFSKTLGFNPDLPKTHFWINLSSITQTLKIFCIKIKEHIILDGHNKIIHNMMYQV